MDPEAPEDPMEDTLLGVVGQTNLKAVSDSFISALLGQVTELNQSLIDARRQQNDAWNQRMTLVSELNSSNTAHHNNINAATLNAVLGTGVIAQKELDKSAEELTAASIGAAVGAKTSDSGLTGTLAALTAAMEQINSRLASLENKGSA